MVDGIVAAGGLNPTLIIGANSKASVRELRKLGVKAAAVSLPDFLAGQTGGVSDPATLAVLGEVEALPQDLLSQFLDSAFQSGARTLYLKVALTPADDGTPRPRVWWERQLIGHGFRFHPRALRVTPYTQIEADPTRAEWVMERCPDQVLDRFPLSWLAQERDLHMDMTREAGVRSEAHIVRYFEAAAYIRPGDRVLDAACGLGYGARVLAENSLAASVLGIDASKSAIDYANVSFVGGDERVSFQMGDLPEAFEAMAPASADFIASFETLEHLVDPQRFLRACARVLAPGGRVMVSVPNDWSDETGDDPNPWHFHVYTWEKLIEEFQSEFLPEAAFAQSASQKKVDGQWAVAGREWLHVGLEDTTRPDSEWCLMLGMRDPLEPVDAPYLETTFPLAQGAMPTLLTDARAQYANPWLLRSLVGTGVRMRDRNELVQLADRVAATYHGGPDEAAALAVLAYALSDDAPDSEVEDLFRAMEPHIVAAVSPEATPVQIRWGISLSFVKGQIESVRGRFDEAQLSYSRAATLPFECFAPLLATKTIESAFRLGVMALGNQDRALARRWWTRGVEAARMALSADWETAFGHTVELPIYAMSELTEIADLATRCSLALSYVDRVGPSAMVAEAFLTNRGTSLRAAWAREQSSYQASRNADVDMAAAVARAEAMTATINQLADVKDSLELWRPFWTERLLTDAETTPGLVRRQDDGGLQVHPAEPGAAPTRAVFRNLPLAGQAATVRSRLFFVENGFDQAAVFRVVVTDSDGAELVRAEATLTPGERQDMEVPVPAGPHTINVVLETEMAQGAAHNYSAWTHFEEVVLVR